MACNDRQDIIQLIADEDGADNAQQELTPEQLLIIVGILTGLLEVNSMFLDRSGRVDIILTGSIKGKNKLQNLL